MKTNVLEKTGQIFSALALVFSLTTAGYPQETLSSKKSSLVNVTFRVDMSERVVSPNGVHLPGTFCNWKTDSLEMLPAGNNIYELTVPCEAGNMEQFKFLNGTSWTNGDENVPEECGVPNGYGGYNRFVNVPYQDTVLKLVCFSRCDACPPRINITFRVSMAWQSVSPDGVHLAGSFNSWDHSVTLLTRIEGSSYYQVVQPLAIGDFVQYRYVNGADIAGEEQVPKDCGYYAGPDNYNRFLSVPAADSVLPLVCYSLCNDQCTVGITDHSAAFAILGQNVPNPFGESSVIDFTIPEKARVSLVIFDLMGRTVKTLADKEMEAGQHRVDLFASDFTPGIYHYRLLAGKSVFTKQMVVIR